jgi:cytochrome d ubiquinol oxidase subunit II
VGEAATRIAAAAGGPPPSFLALYVAPWFAPFPIAVGALALVLFAFLAAVYLILATRDDALREDFRRRALGAAVAVFATAVAALLLAHRQAPAVGRELTGARWALPFQSATAAAAIAAVWTLWTRRYAVARIAAGAEVSLVLWGWALVQYPELLPPGGTIRGLAAPRITLQLLLWGLAGGSAILLPSLAYLFRTFGRAED